MSRIIEPVKQRPTGTNQSLNLDSKSLSSIRSRAVTVSQKGGTLSIKFKDLPFPKATVEESAKPWISVKRTTTLGESALVITFKANLTYEKRKGKVTLSFKVGKNARTMVLSFTQGIHSNLTKAFKVLEQFYEAVDARNWEDPWIPGKTWPGIFFEDKVNFTKLYISCSSFEKRRMKGQVPDCIGDFGSILKSISFYYQPDLAGPLPASIQKLTNLDTLYLSDTSITSVPDVFAGMKSLVEVNLCMNEKMEGPIPSSIGNSPVLKKVNIAGNGFTGTPPASLAKVGRALRLYDNRLSGQIPQSYLESRDARYILEDLLYQQDGYGFDISNVEIPVFGKRWYEGTLVDLNGRPFTMKGITKKNKYTVFLYWAPWCEPSIALLGQLKAFYQAFHDKGIEVIATVTTADKGGMWSDLEGQKQVLEQLGCTEWYNYYYRDAAKDLYYARMPEAEVADSAGNLVFSSMVNLPDPGRNRLGKSVSRELIPFLESIVG